MGAAPHDPPQPPEVKALLARVRRRIAGNVTDWTMEQWSIELAHLRDLSKKHHLGLHRDQRNVYDAPDGSTVVIVPPTVRRVDPPCKASADSDLVCWPLLAYPDLDNPDGHPVHSPLSSFGYLLRWHDVPALIVSLDGRSDEHIRAEVDKALAERRGQEQSSLLRKQAKPAFTRSFADRFMFRKWNDNKISEITELLIWQKQLSDDDREYYSDRVLGEWLFKMSRSAPMAVLDARKVLIEAIGCIPELSAEQAEAMRAEASRKEA